MALIFSLRQYSFCAFSICRFTRDWMVRSTFNFSISMSSTSAMRVRRSAGSKISSSSCFSSIESCRLAEITSVSLAGSSMRTAEIMEDPAKLTDEIGRVENFQQFLLLFDRELQVGGDYIGQFGRIFHAHGRNHGRSGQTDR